MIAVLNLLSDFPAELMVILSLIGTFMLIMSWRTAVAFLAIAFAVLYFMAQELEARYPTPPNGRLHSRSL